MNVRILPFFLTVVLFLGTFLSGISPVHAADLTNLTDADIAVAVTPETPGPYQSVTISISSYSVDLNRAKIMWTLDGKIEPSGTGVKKFSFTTGALGSKSVVTIGIIADATHRVDKQITIEPAQLDLLWESPDSYVPPFYRGKALPSIEATIKIVALPNSGALLDAPAGSLVYQWKHNSSVDQQASGYGKNYYVFRSDYLNKKEIVSVQAADGGTGSFNATDTLEIVPVNPKIVFYADKFNEGTDYGNALVDTTALTENEITIVAAPYFFSPKEKILTPGFKYDWAINNKSIPAPDPKNMLTVQPTEGTTGTGVISLSLENMGKLFQSAKNTINITF